MSQPLNQHGRVHVDSVLLFCVSFPATITCPSAVSPIVVLPLLHRPQRCMFMSPQGLYKMPKPDDGQSGVEASCGSALKDILVRVYRSNSEASKPWRQQLSQALVQMGAEAAAASAQRHLDRQAVRWGKQECGLRRCINMRGGIAMTATACLSTACLPCLAGVTDAWRRRRQRRRQRPRKQEHSRTLYAASRTPNIYVVMSEPPSAQTQASRRTQCSANFSPHAPSH